MPTRGWSVLLLVNGRCFVIGFRSDLLIGKGLVSKSGCVFCFQGLTLEIVTLEMLQGYYW
jgi:hypothetical protein